MINASVQMDELDVDDRPAGNACDVDAHMLQGQFEEQPSSFGLPPTVLITQNRKLKEFERITGSA